VAGSAGRGGPRRPKVFCIGFHKTGTSSLRDALEILGYRVTGPNGTRDPDIAAKLEPMVDALAEKFDAFQDNPWPLVWRRMDARHPGSKFILTVRDEAKWIESNAAHFGETDTPMRQLIYGVGHPKGNEAVYVERMRRHNREVSEYFRDRPDDLLTIDVTRGANWQTLCGFLGLPAPDVPFPHAQSRKRREVRDKGVLGRIAAPFVRPK
jgi:Sulfotransferase domain